MELPVIEKYVEAEKLAADLGLKLIYGGKEAMRLNTVNVASPGLLLAGFTDYFGETRIPVLGNAECEYL